MTTLLATVRAGRERVQYALQRGDGLWNCVKQREGSDAWQVVWPMHTDEDRSVTEALARIRHQHRPQDVTTLAAGRQWMGEAIAP